MWPGKKRKIGYRCNIYVCMHRCCRWSDLGGITKHSHRVKRFTELSILPVLKPLSLLLRLVSRLLRCLVMRLLLRLVLRSPLPERQPSPDWPPLRTTVGVPAASCIWACPLAMAQCTSNRNSVRKLASTRPSGRSPAGTLRAGILFFHSILLKH